MTLITGVTFNEYSMNLEYDGAMYHYTIKARWHIIHHFVDEFDSESDAKDWFARLVAEHLDQIHEGTLWPDLP